MTAAARRLETTLLPGAKELLAAHAREAPQRDDLCGAFCGALALHAAAPVDLAVGDLDQDAVALAAGTVVSKAPDPSVLPPGERGRRDYRVSLPFIDDASRSGTTAAGIVTAVAQLSEGRLEAIAFAGPWTAATLAGLFDTAVALEHPVTLVANLATRHLWGADARPDQLLAYLIEGEQAGPPPDWDVGHFACVFGRVAGPVGSVYCVADTYQSLGRGGVHLQPQERLAVALQRPDMAPGGMIAIVFGEEADSVRSSAREHGLSEGVWDNGTVAREMLR